MTAGTKETTIVSDMGKHIKSESVVSPNTPTTGSIEALRYDPGIMSVMPWAVGCLTGKNTLWCRAFFA
jgi:hypothetical protein